MIKNRGLIIILSAGFLLKTIFGQDYAGLQKIALEFYAYQRAGIQDGTNPHNPFYNQSPYPHAGDSYNGNDMSGGWYDAGDFVKFGLNMGFAAYTLLKGYDVFPRGYDDDYGLSNTSASDGIPDVLNQAKYATDYFLKAVVSNSTVVMDMGQASQEHGDINQSGYQASQAFPNRPAILADGADVPGFYAATLALMSIVYRTHDAAYADQCVAKAKQAFEFGLTHRKICTPQTKAGAALYTSKGWEDKMALAAVELFRATGDATYMEWALEFQQSVSSHYFAVGYDHVGDYSAFELYRQGVNATAAWMADVSTILNRQATGPALIKDAYVPSDWGNAGHAGNSAFSLALAFSLKGNDKYKDFAFQQVEWVSGMGSYPRSYVMGFNSGPNNPHHRNDATIGGLKGSVLSGPAPDGAFDPANPENSNWNFVDDRNQYKYTEPAINYNAGLIGALAFIKDYTNPPAGLVRISSPMVVVKDPLDLNEGAQTATVGFESAQNWTVQFLGEVSGAYKNYTGTGASASVTWDGTSDEGSFVAGEKVVVKVVSDLIASYHQEISRTSFFLSSTLKQPFTAADILLSDFNDGALANTLGGAWETFDDKVLGGASYVSPSTLTEANSITAAGESETKGLKVRLIGKAGVEHPHAGIRTTFNATGAPMALGGFTSVVFDIQPATVDAVLYVEFEQPSVTDGAYPGVAIPLTSTNWSRIRLPVSVFQQPDWKTTAVNLNRNEVTALRFTYYGESNVSFTLDNVHIENMVPGQVISVEEPSRKLLDNRKFRFANGSLQFEMGGKYDRAQANLKLMDLKGQLAYESLLSFDRNGNVAFALPEQLSKGIYFFSLGNNLSERMYSGKIVISQ